ncbi:MAG: hypothetical protein IH959_09985 [Chloroflexi bacterium]|nr:hypothetical protein [Chloroflexota bacterium]
MPQTSTPRQFAKAIQERRSKTTKELKKLFTPADKHKGTTALTNLKKTNALKRPLQAWAKNKLSALSPLELQHIDDWPDNPDKEDVRKALVDAIQNSRTVQFFWELHGIAGKNEFTVIEDPDMTGGITITFRSPRRNVSGGNVTVKVGP